MEASSGRCKLAGKGRARLGVRTQTGAPSCPSGRAESKKEGRGAVRRTPAVSASGVPAAWLDAFRTAPLEDASAGRPCREGRAGRRKRRGLHAGSGSPPCAVRACGGTEPGFLGSCWWPSPPSACSRNSVPSRVLLPHSAISPAGTLRHRPPGRAIVCRVTLSTSRVATVLRTGEGVLCSQDTSPSPSPGAKARRHEAEETAKARWDGPCTLRPSSPSRCAGAPAWSQHPTPQLRWPRHRVLASET